MKNTDCHKSCTTSECHAYDPKGQINGCKKCKDDTHKYIIASSADDITNASGTCSACGAGYI